MLIHCDKTRISSNLIFSIFGLSWVQAATIKENLMAWHRNNEEEVMWTKVGIPVSIEIKKKAHKFINQTCFWVLRQHPLRFASRRGEMGGRQPFFSLFGLFGLQLKQRNHIAFERKRLQLYKNGRLHLCPSLGLELLIRNDKLTCIFWKLGGLKHEE